MNKRIEKIINTYLEKEAIIYERALGAEEIALFMLRAPENDQEKFMKFLGEKRVEEAMGLVEDFLGIGKGDLWDAMHKKEVM